MSLFPGKHYGPNWQKNKLRQEKRDRKRAEYAAARAEEQQAEDVAVTEVLVLLRGLTDEQRLAVFREYCMHCGTDNPFCKCWNDE